MPSSSPLHQASHLGLSSPTARQCTQLHKPPPWLSAAQPSSCSHKLINLLPCMTPSPLHYQIQCTRDPFSSPTNITYTPGYPGTYSPHPQHSSPQNNLSAHPAPRYTPEHLLQIPNSMPNACPPCLPMASMAQQVLCTSLCFHLCCPLTWLPLCLPTEPGATGNHLRTALPALDQCPHRCHLLC